MFRLMKFLLFLLKTFSRPLKKMLEIIKVRSAQVAKRYIEFENCHKILPSRKTYHISDRGLKDSCLVTKYLLCIVTEINLGADTSYFCHVYKLKDLESFYEEPLSSKDLGIYYIQNLQKYNKCKLIKQNEIKRKVALLPSGSGYVCIPLLHETEH